MRIGRIDGESRFEYRQLNPSVRAQKRHFRKTGRLFVRPGPLSTCPFTPVVHGRAGAVAVSWVNKRKPNPAKDFSSLTPNEEYQ